MESRDCGENVTFVYLSLRSSASSLSSPQIPPLSPRTSIPSARLSSLKHLQHGYSHRYCRFVVQLTIVYVMNMLLLSPHFACDAGADPCSVRGHHCLQPHFLEVSLSNTLK